MTIKKIFNLFICCFIFISTLCTNVYGASSEYLLYIKNNGVITKYYITDSQPKVSILEGSAIDGLDVTFDFNTYSFVVVPTKNVTYNDFSMHTTGNLIIDVANDMTISGSLKDFICLESPNKTMWYFDQSVIGVNGTLTITNNHSLNINYSLDSDSYEKYIHTKYATCIYSKQLILGDLESECGPTINIEEKTNPMIYSDNGECQLFSGICIDAPSTIEGGEPAYFYYSNVNIKSYITGIRALCGISAQYSNVHILHKSYKTENNYYTGIKMYLGVLVFNNSSLIIDEEDDCKNISNPHTSAVYIEKYGTLRFHFATFNIDVLKSRGTAFQDLGDNNYNSRLDFMDSYGDIKGKIVSNNLYINIAINSNVYFTSDTTTLNVSNSDESSIRVDESSTCLFETTNSNSTWNDGIKKFDGFNNARTSNIIGRIGSDPFDPKSSNTYCWVAIVKDCAFTLDGIVTNTTTFSRFAEGIPSGHEWETLVGYFYKDAQNVEHEFSFDNYIRGDINVYTKWTDNREPVEQVALTDYEPLYIFPDANVYVRSDLFSCYVNGKYAFKDGSCFVYQPDIYTEFLSYPGEQVYSGSKYIGTIADTYVFSINCEILEYSINTRCFDQSTKVTIDGVEYSLLDESKIINENSTGNFDESYEGYYISEDKKNLYIQLVETVPYCYLVDSFNVTNNGFDFDTYSPDIELPANIDADIIMRFILLSKGNDIKYYIASRSGQNIVLDANQDILGLYGEVTLTEEIDRAVVANFIGQGGEDVPIYTENTKFYSNGVELTIAKDGKDKMDAVPIVGFERFDAPIDSNLEFAYLMPDNDDMVVIQLYYEKEKSLIKEIPLEKPTSHTNGHLPYYTDGKGNYFEDPEGKEPISNIDEWLENKGKISVLSDDNKKEIEPTSNEYEYLSKVDPDNFVYVTIDGNILKEGIDYIKQDKNGSTIIKLTDKYIASNIGKHVMEVVSKNGFSTISIEIKNKTPDNPPHSDDSGGSSSYSIPKTGIR